MLTVLWGSHNPDLDAALRAHLERFAAQGDFSRMALVVPSGEMRRALRIRIARDWGMTCLGLHLVTAYSLAERITSGAAAGVEHMSSEAALGVLARQLVRESRTADDGVAWVQELCDVLQVPSLADNGVTPDDFPVLIEKAAISSSMKGNPIKLTPDELREILARAL